MPRHWPVDIFDHWVVGVGLKGFCEGPHLFLRICRQRSAVKTPDAIHLRCRWLGRIDGDRPGRFKIWKKISRLQMRNGFVKAESRGDTGHRTAGKKASGGDCTWLGSRGGCVVRRSLVVGFSLRSWACNLMTRAQERHVVGLWWFVG